MKYPSYGNIQAMKENLHFRQIILQLMKAAGGMSESELARKVGLKQQTVHRLLSGTTPDPRISTLIPIAKHFNITIGQLLGEEYILDKNNVFAPNQLLEITKTKEKLRKLNQSLFEAAKSGDIKTVKTCIKNGANLHLLEQRDIHPYDNNENNPLHISAREGHLSIVKFLIENGTKIDVRNRKKQTSLHWAVYNGRIKIIKYLIEKGAFIEAVDDDGASPFAWAAYVNKLETANLLINMGAELNSRDYDNNTPLHWACYRGHVEIVRFLIENGVNVGWKNKNGYTPIECAVENGHYDVVVFLTKVLKRKNFI